MKYSKLTKYEILSDGTMKPVEKWIPNQPIKPIEKVIYSKTTGYEREWIPHVLNPKAKENHRRRNTKRLLIANKLDERKPSLLKFVKQIERDQDFHDPNILTRRLIFELITLKTYIKRFR